MIRITLKNYRCFADTKPAVIDYSPGFTAFVGPNNAGKSTFLRFIYEYQGLWGNLISPAFLQGLTQPGRSPVGLGALRGVVDTQEVVCDFTRRPVTVEFKLLDPPPTSHLLRITMSASSDPTAWTGELELGPGSRHIHEVQGSTLIDTQRNQVAWQPFQDMFAAFHQVLFAPAFRNAINEGSGNYFDLAVGTTVVSQWNQWKAGSNRAAKQAIQSITENIRRIFGFRTLEINSSADGKTLEVVVDSRPFRLNDLGAGLSQFVILFINAAVRKPSLLLIDEPELNLHPSLQIDFLTALASYAGTGSVIFATHSLGLARAVAERIYTFTPGHDGTAVSLLERTPNYAEFAGEMGFGGYRELGYKTILMVEGPSEVKTMQQFLRILGHDHEIVVLHLGGSSLITGGRDAELAELLRLSDKIAVIVDSERASQGAAIEASRQAFLDTCSKLKFETHTTDLRATENYFPNRAVKEAKGPSYNALAPYQRLKDANPAWGKQENWRIARVMTEQELLSSDVGKFLQSVCEN